MSKILLRIWQLIKKYKKTTLLLVVLGVWGGYSFYYNRSFPADTGEYVPYILGQNIKFTAHGNSDTFVKMSDGWGEQESAYRCTVEPDVFMKLYVKNNDQALKLSVMAAGSFPEPYDYQDVTVFVNGTKLKLWKVSANEWYNVIIPASLIADNKIEIRFNIARPFTPVGDTRKLGMIVRKIRLNKVYFQETRVKMRDWLIERIKNNIGELTPEEIQSFQEPQI